jgi:hypothetical protein
MRTLCTFLIALVVGAVPQGPPLVEGCPFWIEYRYRMTLVELRACKRYPPSADCQRVCPVWTSQFDRTSSPQPPLTTMTNGAGHFQFAAVPPGSIALRIATKRVHSAEYGQRSPSGEDSSD